MNLIEKLREPRIGGFAVFDFAAAFGAAWLAAPYLEEKLGVSKTVTMMSVIPAGFFVHEALGISTPLNRAIEASVSGLMMRTHLAGLSGLGG